MDTIGFVGTGAMGSRMAGTLLQAGYSLQVFNRDPAKTVPLVQRGARSTGSPAEAASGAAVVVVIVSDDAADRAVVTGDAGILAGATPGAVIIDSTTATPRASKALAQAAAERGCRFLDAPVLGSLAQAENRELVFVVGGDTEALERAKPVFAAMGRLARHVGPSGAGATLKLLNNMISGATTAALGEAAVVAEAAGVDPAALVEVLSEGAAGSRLTRTKLPKMLKREFSPQFQLALLEKDLRYFLDLARDVDCPTPLAALVGNLYCAAKRVDLGAADSSALFSYQAGELVQRK